MEVDGDYPDEITSFRVSEARSHEPFSLSKKRKFQSDQTKEQLLSLQKPKYICCEHGPFSNQSLQGEFFCMQSRRGKAGLQEVDEDTHTREESTQDSNSVAGESFSQSSDIKSWYDESCSQSGPAVSRDNFCSMDSTTVNGSSPSDNAVQEDGIREEQLDEFGHCLTYLASACGSDSNKPEIDQELEDFLYSNGMLPTSSEEEAQLSTGKVTIDQEFEQYFSTLML